MKGWGGGGGQNTLQPINISGGGEKGSRGAHLLNVAGGGGGAHLTRSHNHVE